MKKQILIFKTLNGIQEVFKFSSEKQISKEVVSVEIIINGQFIDYGDGVEFTDGSMLLVAIDRGFSGTDVTPADPPRVQYFSAEKC